jgi:hypothetical protein
MNSVSSSRNSVSSSRRCVSAHIAVTIAFLIVVFGSSALLWAQTPQASSAGRAAWAKIATVLEHPRCLNCHQVNSPLQNDSRRPHVPQVVRGPDNHGVAAMRCGTCHTSDNNPTSRTPGAPNWQLAPVSMRWQGLSSGELCRVLKDPAHNGNRSGASLIEHVANDPLVAWGWDPGEGREPVPIPHQEVVDLMKVWVGAGAPCPQ